MYFFVYYKIITPKKRSAKMQELEPNEQRAKQAILLIWIVLALEVASLASGYSQYNLLQAAASGVEIPDETLDANDLRESAIAIIYLIAFIISAIAFIRWFECAYSNLHKKVTNLSYKASWASLGWFVPILCFYRPYKIMKELYCETGKIINGKPLYIHFVIGWWVLWIFSAIIGKAILRSSIKQETIEQLISSTYMGMIANFLGILLALITIKVIKDYSEAELLFKEKVSL
jgi:hypothetical protein